jgi:hypothetical protein
MFKVSVKSKRQSRLLPGGVPRWIRCYDNGGTDAGGSIDRYTVIYTGRWKGRERGTDYYVAMNAAPFHPQGFGQHGEISFSQLGDGQTAMDRPKYSHLGKKITFKYLPTDCQKLVLSDYKDIWGLE